MERRHRIGWVLYDFSNSTYHLMMPTVLIPLYFRQYLAAGSSSPDLLWAILISVPVALAGIFAPFIGAIGDFYHSRFKILVLSAVISIAFATSLITVGQKSLATGALLFAISYFFFTLSLGIYDGLFPIVSEPKKRGTLSGLGWGIGYLGGIVALLACFPLLKDAQLPDDAMAFKTSIIIVCIMYTLFAAVSFIFLRGAEKAISYQSMSDALTSTNNALKRVLKTIHSWRDDPEVFKTLGSYYLANDGLTTLVYFTSIYAASTLGFTSQQILKLFLIVQLVGVPMSAFGGFLADKFGHRRVLFGTLSFWVILCVSFAFGRGITLFYILSIGTGLVIGTTPAVFRSLLANLINTDRSAEMFGFNSFASRASAILGPLLFGAVIAITGSQRIAMLFLVLFFALSAYILIHIKESHFPNAESNSHEI